MKLAFAALGMALLLSVGALALGAVASLVAVVFGFPLGWAIVLALYCTAFAQSGWRGLSGGMGVTGLRHNGDAAFALLHAIALAVGVAIALSSIPNEHSALWGLTLPLAFLAGILVQITLEALLNVVNASGRRQ
jgi:hypothetical protein